MPFTREVSFMSRMLPCRQVMSQPKEAGEVFQEPLGLSTTILVGDPKKALSFLAYI